MPEQIDIKKAVKYPPEIIPFAKPIDLYAGDNKVFEYSNIQGIGYIAGIYGISFARADGLNFRMNADGVYDVVRIENLGAVKGIDYEEEVKIPARDSITGIIYTPSNVSAFQMRHKIRVDKPTVLLKSQLGFPLSDYEKELARKYNVDEIIATQSVVPYDPYEGIQKIFTYTSVLSSSGTLLRLPVPSGYKAVLLDISALRPTSPATAYITLQRDRSGYYVFELDPYCMQNLEYSMRVYRENSIRIVCLDEMLVEMSVSSGTHKVRLVVGLGKITIPEKIKWDIDLTAGEMVIAEKENLYELVEVGLR